MSVDMSKVKVGTRVKYRNGEETVITEITSTDRYPFRTGTGIWHKTDGSCCAEHLTHRDIVEIIEDVVQPVATHKPTRKRSAPLYGELLNERELLKIDNHNMRLEIQSLRMANEGLRNRLTGYDTASLSKLVALWFRNRKGGGK